MLTVAEAMSASMHWNFLAKYSILKETFADLRSIVTTWCKQPACGGGEQGCREGEEHEHSGGSANVLLVLEQGMEKKEAGGGGGQRRLGCGDEGAIPTKEHGCRGPWSPEGAAWSC